MPSTQRWRGIRSQCFLQSRDAAPHVRLCPVQRQPGLFGYLLVGQIAVETQGHELPAQGVEALKHCFQTAAAGVWGYAVDSNK
jgi:hypothetical protein